MCPTTSTRDCIRNMSEMVTARQHSYSTAYILYHCKLILFSNMYVIIMLLKPVLNFAFPYVRLA